MNTIKKISLAILTFSGMLFLPLLTFAIYDISCDNCTPKLNTSCYCSQTELNAKDNFNYSFNLKPAESKEVRAHCSGKLPSGVGVDVNIHKDKADSVRCDAFSTGTEHTTSTCHNWSTHSHTVKITGVTCKYIKSEEHQQNM